MISWYHPFSHLELWNLWAAYSNREPCSTAAPHFEPPRWSTNHLLAKVSSILFIHNLLSSRFYFIEFIQFQFWRSSSLVVFRQIHHNASNHRFFTRKTSRITMLRNESSISNTGVSSANFVATLAVIKSIEEYLSISNPVILNGFLFISGVPST